MYKTPFSQPPKKKSEVEAYFIPQGHEEEVYNGVIVGFIVRVWNSQDKQ